jgi:hypothetical protein
MILSDTPVTWVGASKLGYLEQQLTFDQGTPAPPEIEISLKYPEGGLFGRAIDDEGRPVYRFRLRFFDTSSQWGSARYTRDFQDDNGLFLVTDVPAGAYDVAMQSLPYSSLEPGPEMRLGQMEIRKGYYFGEIILRIHQPKAKR